MADGVGTKTVIIHSLIAYLEGLTITQGQGRGEPFKLLPWERRFIRGAFGTTGDAAMSLARGNGKTTVVSGLGAAAVDDDGPLVEPRAETVIVASSFDQGRIAFNHTFAFLEQKGHDLSNRKKWRVQDSTNRATIENRATGASVRIVGSDPKRAHGLAPVLVICDEPAQWPATTADAMHAALKTALGKIPGSRMIALGTRPASPDHFFQKMLDGGAAYAQCHAAAPDDPVFQVRTWHKANPSLRYMPYLLERIRLEAADAKRDSALLPQFKALRLNLGVSDVEVQLLIDSDTWRQCEGAAERSGAYTLGLDLGTSAAMSAAAGYWHESGALDVVACFGGIPGLPERGLSDGVGRRYQDFYNRNELILSDGRVSKLSDLMSAVLDRWGAPAAIACDRWREDELRDTLDDMKFPRCQLVVRGQGYLDGGQDVREFRRAVLNGEVTPARSGLLRYAMSEARVVMDTSGNSKLAKKTEGQRRLRARDDAAAAGILAVAVGSREQPRKSLKGAYLGKV